jgi:hypothetical protein
MGLGHVVQSYVDEATIAFTADRDVMPDPEFYAQCIQDSFDELLAAAQKISGAAEARKTGPIPAPRAARSPQRGTKPKEKGSIPKPVKSPGRKTKAKS